jgi:hypothetical protein
MTGTTDKAKAEHALGSVLFAIEAFHRDDLLAVGTRFTSLSGLSADKPLRELSDANLREFLERCARHLRKRNPEDLTNLAETLVNFARTELAKSND